MAHPQAQNHPHKGDQIKAEPIRSLADIERLKALLADKPRDLALFTFGINTNLRAIDLVKLKVGQVRGVRPGETFTLREQKTGKPRLISLNPAVVAAVGRLLATMPDAPDEAWLFPSRKKNCGGKLTVPTVNNLVKAWTAELGLRGNYGAHTLRKTFGYMHRTVHRTDLPTLMKMFNHATQAQTLAYLCIQEDEIQDAYMKEL